MPPIVVSVRGLIIHHDKLLMCQLKPEHDWHCLPGGKLESSETLEAGLTRELIEETTIKPIVGKLLFVNQFMNAENHRVEFFFRVENSADYADFDYSQATHAFEVANFIMDDPTDPRHNLLPAFIGERFDKIIAQGDEFETEIVVSN